MELPERAGDGARVPRPIAQLEQIGRRLAHVHELAAIFPETRDERRPAPRDLRQVAAAPEAADERGAVDPDARHADVRRAGESSARPGDRARRR
jgi:hypothetical protein